MSKKEKESTVAEALKKVISIGVGAAFMTEDAVKTVLKDLPLPKEVITGLVSNAKGVKEEFINSIKDEVQQHLSKVDPKSIAEDIINQYDFKIDATIELVKKKSNDSVKKES